MSNKKIIAKKMRKFLWKFTRISSVVLTMLATILSSFGPMATGWVPAVRATAPMVEMVQYLTPISFEVRFSQQITSGLSAASFTLWTSAAGDTETITGVVAGFCPAPNDTKTCVTVTASGAKISPSFSDSWVKVASGADPNAPKNGTDANMDGNMIGIMMPPGQVVISEVKLAGSTATDEFVEIYNRGSNVSLNGWKLAVLNSSGVATDLVTFPNVTINSGQFRLIGPTGTANADNTYTASGNGIDADNTIVLYKAVGPNFKAEDIVGCGAAIVRESMTIVCPAANSSIERKASSSSTSASMAAGGGEANKGNSYDTNSNNFDFVTQTTPVPQNSSQSETATFTNQPPNIMHMPVSQVPASTDAMIFADFMDSETPQNNLTGNLTYSTDNKATWKTPLVGQYMAGSGFKFVIPAADVGTGVGTAFNYYLKVTDGNSTSTCMSATTMGACGDESGPKAGSWAVARIDGSGWTNVIKGQVKSGGTGIDNVNVTLRGAGLTFNTATATDGATVGAFTFSGVPSGLFRVEAKAPGYLDGWLDGVPSKASGAAYSDWTLNITVGTSGGGGGDMNTPQVMWSAPMDGMMGAPTKIDITSAGMIQAPILIGFSKDMDSTTITTTNIKVKPVTAAGVVGTELAGISVAYQPQNGSVTLSDRSNFSANMGPDRKAILYSATALAENSQYVVAISGAVKDTAGNALQGNQPGGGHNIMFSTGSDFSSQTGSQMQGNFTNFMTGSGGGGGEFSPPYVTGSAPGPGTKNVPTNTKIMINFSKPMDTTGINVTSTGKGTYVKLYDPNYNNTGVGEYVDLSSVSLDTATKQTATVTAASLAQNHSYAIRVLGGAKSATGMPMSMPGQENNVMYQADFTTGSGTDTGAPSVLGTTLQMYTAVSPCASYSQCVTGIPVNVGVIEATFSKDMDASTLTTSNVTLKSGTTTVSTTVQYDPMNRSVKIVPSTVLYTVTNYVLTISGTGVKAMNTTALGTDYTVSFITSADVDVASPSLQFANGDDYKMAVSFSEPMQSAKATDINNWAASVLNPANYILFVNNAPPIWTLGVNASPYFENANLSTAVDAAHGGPLTFKYDASYNTVIIEGLKLLDPSLAIKGGFSLWVKNVKDLSGNLIADSTKTFQDFGANSAGGPVNSAKDTFGMIGPGGGGMSGPPPTGMLSGGAMTVTAFGGKDPGMMGIKPIGVWPMNMLAGQESLYMIDIPLSSAITASGQIILTFPVGFDVTNATDADPNKQWAHKDINGPGAGTVTIASIAKNSSSRTVTITLGAVATQANDFLHLEIDRIKNTTSATDADMTAGVSMGSGYQVDIYTKTGTSEGSRTLETLKSMPFFIKKAGSSTLTGTITFKNASGANTSVSVTDLPIYLMSPITGPLKTLVTLSGEATKTYTFSNLPTGSYMLGTESLQSIGATDYYVDLMPMPQSVQINSGANSKNITFQAQNNTTKPQVTVYITGTFSNDKVDIFAGGPQGFAVKTVTLNGTFTSASPSTQTIYLPATGNWMVGMGPAMPRGPQQAGPPPMPSWMPPQPVNINVLGSSGTWTWQDPSGAASGDTANDGKITVAVTTANKTISGHVKDPAGTTALQNIEVYAYSPTGGMGSRATSGADGSFQLKVIDGSYKVGVFVPGKPPSQEIPVEVKTVNNVTTIYANGTATTDLIFKTSNPESMLTISGKVTDGTNVIKDASVYARSAVGNIGAKTDSMGKYILYVQPSTTWTVGVFLPQYGNLTEQTVTIGTASQSNIDFAPAIGTTFYTVTDYVYKDVGGTTNSYDLGTDTLLFGVHIDFSKSGYRNETISQNGVYTIKVPAGTYTVTGWSPTVGKIPPQTVIVSGSGDMNLTDTADLPVSDTKTVTINFKDSLGAPVTLDKVYAQMDKIGSKDVSNEVTSENVSSLTLDVPAGTGFQYAVNIDIPGFVDSALDISTVASSIVTANDIDGDGTTDLYNAKIESNTTLNVTLPNIYTITGTAKDDSNNLLSNTVINIKKPGSDVSMTVKTDESGNYTAHLPASGATPYLFQIDKGGYVDTGISVPVTQTGTKNLDAQKTNSTISGQIKVGSSGVEGAKVFAKELGGGFVSTETDAQGNYALSVTPGDWKISASNDYYQEKKYQNASSQDIVVPASAATPQTGVNITLATAKSGLAGLNNSDVTPSSGATFADSSANLEVLAPQNAIASSQSTYQLEDSEVSSIASSPTAKTIGGEAVEIKAYEPSGSSMVLKSNFDSDVTIAKKYLKSELVAEGIDTFAKAKNVKMSYFDESASNWEPVPTNVTYFDSADKPVIPTSTLSNVSSVVYAGVSDHMTVYSPTNQTPDGLAPSAPTNVAGSSASNGITVTWTAPITNRDTTTLTDLLGYEVYRSTSASGTYAQVNTSDVITSASYTDTSATAGIPYYYKITAADTGGIESNMSGASSSVTRAASSSGGGAGVPVTTPPTNTSIVIAGGAANTLVREVTLTLAATGANQMAISNTADFSGVSWETYAASKSWTLTAGDGTKTVYAKFRDAGGDVSTAVSDTIILGTSTGAETPSASTSIYPDGTLIKSDSAPEIYVIKDGKRVWVPNAQAFISGGYKWENVKVVSGEVLKQVGSATLIRVAGDPRVYAVVNNARRHIKTAEEFNSQGYKWADIVTVSAAELEAYPESGAVAVGGKTIVVTAASLRIRSTNSTGGKALGWVKKNDNYSVLDENNGWYKITSKTGITGWVSGQYATAASAAAGATPSSMASGNIVINNKWLRVRSISSTKGTILGYVNQGEAYALLGEENGWYKIKTKKGKEGWVSGEYAAKQ